MLAPSPRLYRSAENDIEMLELAGLAIAMGNAPDGVRSVADFVTGSNREDGAAAALERHFLQGLPGGGSLE